MDFFMRYRQRQGGSEHDGFIGMKVESLLIL
jgi:hypothetical protein